MSSLNEDSVGTLHPVTPVSEVLSKVYTIPVPDADEAYNTIMDRLSIDKEDNSGGTEPAYSDTTAEYETETDRYLKEFSASEEDHNQMPNIPNSNNNPDELDNPDTSKPFIDTLLKNGIPSIMEEGNESDVIEVWGGFEDIFTEDGDIIDDVKDLFTESAKIDDDIKETIDLLNSKGYKTIASCSGHPSARSKSDGLRDGVMYNKLYSAARVVFDKDYEFSKIPDGWKGRKLPDGKYGIYVEGPTFNIVKGFQKDQFATWKKSYMRRLRTWADNLPKYGSTYTESANESIESMLDTLMLESMLD